MAGSSAGVEGTSPMVTLKLSPAGQLLWTAQFPPDPDPWQPAVARGLSLDSSGTAIVVGDFQGDLLTVKYSPAGGLLWAARYCAEEAAGMSAMDVRVDGADNVIAAGNLYGQGTNDAVLVKYAPHGQQLWAGRIPHPRHAFHLRAVDLDSQGDSYLTGTPNNRPFTVKIGANGNQLWSTEESSSTLFYEYGEAIQTDGHGGVIIAGRTFDFTESAVSVVKYRQTIAVDAPVVSVSPARQHVAPGTDVTFTAAALGAGALHYQWRFTGRPIPDATGPSLTLTNVQASHRGDYSVIVSNAVGVTVSPEVRLKVLVQPVVSALPSNQVAFVGAQAEFSVGFGDTEPFDYYWRGTTPFTFQWRHDGTNLAGATNAVLRLEDLTTSEAGGYSVVVVNPAGSVTSSVVSLTVSRELEQAPPLRYHGQSRGNDDRPLIQITPAGETIVVGASDGNGRGTDIVLLKYSRDDQLVWSARFHRDPAQADGAADLTLDTAGNIYIAGYSGQPYGDRAFTTLKYDADGHLLWARHFQGVAPGDNVATSLAVDSAGNVTVAGRAGTFSMLIRYDALGATRWTAQGEDSGYAPTQAVVVNAAGDSFLGATRWQDNQSDFLLRKYDAAGAAVWTRTFDSGGYDVFAALALDRAGNIVVAGSSRASLDVAVIKYASDGTHLWSTNFTGLATEDFVEEFYPRALALDEAGRIFVVSSIEDDDDDSLGTAIIKIDAQGHLLWKAVERDLEVLDRSRMAIDSFGNSYATGRAYRSATAYDVATVKYDATGNRRWLVHYAGPGLSTDSGTAVAVDNAGSVRVAGNSNASIGQGMDLILLRYRQQDPSAALRIGLARMEDGSFRFDIPPRANATLEASSDLTHWGRITENELQDLLRLRHPAPPPFPQRFFRLVSP